MEILAVDIGNTITRIGIVDPDLLLCVKQSRFPTAEIASRFDNEFTVATSTAAVSGNLKVSVSCVVPAQRALLEEKFQDSNISAAWVGYHAGLPFRHVYADPGLCGADRIANALYCVKAFPGRTVVIIDAGTAIKIDVVKNGAEFAGGVIMPGVDLQSWALQGGTAQLPRLGKVAVPTLPGTSTTACIAGGIYYGIAGGIERIVAALRNAGTEDVLAVATGGGWPVISSMVNLDVCHIPDMTLVGTGIF